MKRFSEQLQNKAASVRLKTSEREDLRARVVSYMEYHPLPKSVENKVTTNNFFVPEGEMRIFNINLANVFKIGGSVFAALIISVSYFAEQAVPGDSLYAIKVQVNEEVRSTLARSPYEKVVWETERLNRRVAEARLLASEGRLTGAVEVEVANAVREHSENALREIEVLKQTDKEEAAFASIQLTTALDVQATSLLTNDLASSTEGNSTALIASVLAETKQNEAAAGQDNEVPSYSRLIAHSEQETTRAYELLQSISDLATTEEKEDIERRLEDIERSINESMGQADGDDLPAREQLVAVLERTQRLVIFMTNIDVREVVTVEEIVPITLMPEEKRTAIEEMAKSIILMLDQADVLLSATTSDALREKLVPAAEKSRAEANLVLEQLQVPESDLAALELRVGEAHAYALDIATMLNIEVNLQKAVEAITNAEIKITELSTTTASSTPIATTTDAVVEDENLDVKEVEPVI